MARIITPSRRNVKFFRRAPILSRSGVAPPTGTIHPRESRGTADGKQESNKRFISGGGLSGFGIAGGYLAGVELSGRGFNPRPAQGRPAFRDWHKDDRHSATGTRMAGIPRLAQGWPAFRDWHKDGRHSATGTRMAGIPRLAQGRPAFPNWHKQERINDTISALRFRFPCLRGRTLRRPWALSRSGVAPPTGTIHPRESRGTTDGKQESNKRFISGRCLSGFGIAGGYLAGVELSGRGFNPRPAQG